MKTETFLLIAAGVLIALLILEGDLMPNTIYDRIAKAIMEFEGYFEGSVSHRNNNPGNLKNFGQFGPEVGTDNQGHAVFPTFQDGYRALVDQVKRFFRPSGSLYNSSMNLYQIFGKYAEANSKQYAEFVASRIGADPKAPVSQLV